LLPVRDARDRSFAFRILLRMSCAASDIFVEHELLFGRHSKEGEHVTARERRDRGFLRIVEFRISEISGRGRRLHLMATVKLPSVIARIFLVFERPIAAFPSESNFVFGHAFT